MQEENVNCKVEFTIFTLFAFFYQIIWLYQLFFVPLHHEMLKHCYYDRETT
jgi:hypothetical protein